MDLENLPVNIPEEKFTEYAFNPIKQPDKARAFKEALGYTISNYQELICNIKVHLNKKQFVFKENNGHGNIYEYIVLLKGANGKEAKVCTGWIIENGKRELRLTTVYVTKRSVTNNG